MKATVCIPLFNVKPYYLTELLESLVDQQNFIGQVLIIDDMSKVDYSEVISKYSFLPNFTHLRNEVNQGMVTNWNSCLGLANEDFLMILGHDDRLCNGALETFNNLFIKFPNVNMIGAGADYIDSNGQLVKKQPRVNDRKYIFLKKDLYVLKPKEITYLTLRNGCPIGELSAVAYRRTATFNSSRFDLDFKHSADVEFSIRAAQNGLSIYTRKSLIERRIHKENLTNINYTCGYVSQDREKIYKLHIDDYDFSSVEREYFRIRLAITAFFDIFSGIRQLSANLIKNGSRQFILYGKNNPKHYYYSIKEILTRTNIDAR